MLRLSTTHVTRWVKDRWEDEQRPRTPQQWLKLLSLPIVLLAGALLLTLFDGRSLLLNGRYEARSQKPVLLEQFLTLEKEQDTILRNCINDLTDLMVHQGLSTSRPGDSLRTNAAVRVSSALRQLNNQRKSLLLQFLTESQLINGNGDDVVIHLHNVDLSGTNLRSMNLSGVDLKDAKLRGADLRNATLFSATLSGADLREARLEYANLFGANMNGANLAHAHLKGASLYSAHLKSAQLVGSDLKQADFQGADLQAANLKEAQITPEQLTAAWSLEQAILPDGSKYPSKSYPLPARTE
jgi:uncharacterized protein YjbI with pentapeptide repeats